MYDVLMNNWIHVNCLCYAAYVNNLIYMVKRSATIITLYDVDVSAIEQKNSYGRFSFHFLVLYF